MKVLTIAIITCLLICTNSFTAPAQTKPEVLTNKSIMELYKAGLSNNLIVSKIQSSSTKFDVTTTALIALKKEGLPEDIIEAMVNKGTNSSSQTGGDILKPVETTTSSMSSIPDPELINTVYLYKRPNGIIPLEKSTATMRSRKKVLGYGGVNLVFEIAGDKSPVRFTKDSTRTFIVNTGGGAGDAFVLYKVEVKKTSREAVATKFTSFGDVKGSQGVIAINVKMLKPNVYELIPVTSLEKGEYFFATQSAATAVSNSADVYAFGID